MVKPGVRMVAIQPSVAHTTATRRTPIIYYGTGLPVRERARQLRDAIVVLQPYHPLCEFGGFADYFPHAWRFVYFNPTAAHTRLLTDPGVRAATLGYDATWDLERLDLRSGAARGFAIAQGRMALRIDGVHGLFVDDLDRWDNPADRHHAYAVLDALITSNTYPIAWFLNRGFGFWKRLHGLAAVLLEDLGPYQLDRMDSSELSWVTTVVLKALRYASTRGVNVYSLTYDPIAVGWQPRGLVAATVAAATGTPLLAQRHLDRWPQMLTEED
jgi:hypothetical protein